MADKKKDGGFIKRYYNDLAALFRDGPVVRKRIANKIRAPGDYSVPVGTAKAFLKNTNAAYASTMASYGQYNRLARFSDYNEMESMAEIASTLDLLADETIANSEDEEFLKIVSSNKKIRESLQVLFYDTLNLDFEAWRWVRNMLKFGDQFLLIDHHPDYGILAALPLPVNEIEREEGFDPDNPLAYRYRWITQGNKVLENWQIIHFRMAGNDAFIPYGSSYLEAARRSWRQLILMEDAVMIYRVTRSPERRVFRIDVGNVAPQDVPALMEKARNQMKSNQIVDSTTGRVDIRFNALSVSDDYFLAKRGEHGSDISTLPGGQFPVRQNSIIPLLDGRRITIKQLSEEFDSGKINWVYSIKDKTGEFVPGKVVWCGKNYECHNIHRVWLDDGTYVDMAPEHPVIMRDGSTKRTDELASGDSLMPLRGKSSEGKVKGYQIIQDPFDDKWRFVHRRVAKSVDGKKGAIERSGEKNLCVHHCDFDKHNNSPDNLKWMGFWEHREYHRLQLDKSLHSEKSRKKLRKTLQSEDHRAFVSARTKNPDDALCQWIHGEENKRRLAKRNKSQEARERTSKMNRERWDDPKFKEAHSGENHGMVKKFKKLYSLRSLEDLKEFCFKNNAFMFKDVLELENGFFESKALYRSFLKFHGVNSWTDFAKNYLNFNCRNHKVDYVEVLNEPDDVYCMTVLGPNGEEDRHNFGIISCGSDLSDPLLLNGIFVKNTGDIQDLEYIRNKLLAALKIPKSYLGFDEGLGNKATLCLSLDTQIPLLDGRVLSLKEIIDEHEQGNKLQVYSVDTNKGRIIHGDIKWAGVTQKNASLLRVWLDNGEFLDCTSNHELILRDGRKVQLNELKVGASIMPLNKRFGQREYEEIYHPFERKWEFTHRAVALSSGKYVQGKVIHHKDFNKYNNSSDNLDCSMTWLEHRRYHQKHLKETITPEILKKNHEDPSSNWNKWIHSDEHREQSREFCLQQFKPGNPFYDYVYSEQNSIDTSEKMKEVWQRPEYRALKIQQNKDKWDDPEFREAHSGENHWIAKKYKDYDFKWLVDFCVANEIKEKKEFLSIAPIGVRYLDKILKENLHGELWREFRRQYLDCDTNHKIVKIEKLDHKEDVGCLTIDNGFHNFAVGCGIFVGNSQLDVHFARTIQRIQKVFVAELNKIAVIHLWSMGFRDDELENFEIKMANPSSISELQRLELLRTKFEVASMIPQNGMFDKQYAYEKIFKLPPEEVEAIEEGRRKDQMMDMEIMQMQPPVPMQPGQMAPGIMPPAMPGLGGMGAMPPPPMPQQQPAQPINAAKDPNMQDVAPNELTKTDTSKKEKSLSPDLYNYVFNTKKTGMDFKRNKSELQRMVRAPFGEGNDEEIYFKQRHAFVKRIVEELEEIEELKNEPKKLISD